MNLKRNLKSLSLAALAVFALSTSVSLAEEACPLPKPTAEHTWLQQMVGEWKTDTEAYMEPGKPPVHSKGAVSVRPVGSFWTVSEIKDTMMNMPFSGQMTFGYDPTKKKYVATAVNNITNQLWLYEGTVDATGKTLTLETEGNCPKQPGKLLKFKDVIEFPDKNHQTFTSYIQTDDGKWVPMMASHATRQK